MPSKPHPSWAPGYRQLKAKARAYVATHPTEQSVEAVMVALGIEVQDKRRIVVTLRQALETWLGRRKKGQSAVPSAVLRKRRYTRRKVVTQKIVWRPAAHVREEGGNQYGRSPGPQPKRLPPPVPALQPLAAPRLVKPGL
jgi:hypothetical protein